MSEEEKEKEEEEEDGSVGERFADAIAIVTIISASLLRIAIHLPPTSPRLHPCTHPQNHPTLECTPIRTLLLTHPNTQARLVRKSTPLYPYMFFFRLTPLPPCQLTHPS